MPKFGRLVFNFFYGMNPFFRDVPLPLWSTSSCVVADSKAPRQVFVASRYKSVSDLSEAVGSGPFGMLHPHVAQPKEPFQLHKTNLQPPTLKSQAVNALLKNFPNLKEMSPGALKEMGIPERIAAQMGKTE